MKKLSIYCGAIVLIFLLFGCSSTKSLMPDTESSKDDEQNTGIVNEFFDPLILDEEDLNIKKTISVESTSDQVKEDVVQPNADYQKTETVPGYRVQICAVSDEDKARMIQRDAIFKFINEEVYLIYDSPYYKVRVGNCLTRYEADKLQQFAVEKGFDDAWVVRTKITLKSNENSSKKIEY